MNTEINSGSNINHIRKSNRVSHTCSGNNLISPEVLRSKCVEDNIRLIQSTPSHIIPTIHYKSLSYAAFFRDFLSTNNPVVIESKCVDSLPHQTDDFVDSDTWIDWRIKSEWVKQNPNYCEINKSHLTDHYGDAIVPVMEIGPEGNRDYVEMSLRDFLFNHMNRDEDDKDSNQGLDLSSVGFYLKDWHFVNSFPEINPIYKNPIIFTEDWLNYYCDYKGIQDYRFVYLGCKGTYTPFHCDVLKSFSWSSNICGEKLWLFFQPGAEDYLKDNLGNYLQRVDLEEDFDVLNIKSNHGSNPNKDLVRECRRKLEESGRFKCVRIIQRAGETIFVPSGWYHQVVNLCETLSVNHNWVNACNIEFMWNSLKEDLKGSQQQLIDLVDLPDYDILCQQLLKGNCGVDLTDFYNFVYFIARMNCVSCEIDRERGMTDEERDGDHYLVEVEDLDSCGCSLCSYRLFNLCKLRPVIDDMISVVHKIEKSGSDSEASGDYFIGINTEMLNKLRAIIS